MGSQTESKNRDALARSNHHAFRMRLLALKLSHQPTPCLDVPYDERAWSIFGQLSLINKVF
jgi:hypothetical protein